MGVDKSTILNWEKNRRGPAIQHIAAIICFLGYTPLSPGSSLPERLATYRQITGLSQKKLAAMVSVDEGTLRKWERGSAGRTASTKRGSTPS